MKIRTREYYSLTQHAASQLVSISARLLRRLVSTLGLTPSLVSMSARLCTNQQAEVLTSDRRERAEMLKCAICVQQIGTGGGGRATAGGVLLARLRGRTRPPS